MNRAKLAKWTKWLGNAELDGTIAYELANLAVIRRVHSGLKQMVNDNPNLQKHSAFYSVLDITYYQSALMYIRRQVRKDQDSTGLIKLAKDIHDNSCIVTKEFYSNIYIKDCTTEEDIATSRKRGEEDFEKHFGGDNVDHLDSKIIKEDIDELETVYKLSSSFTDRRLAHLDHREPSRIPDSPEIESWCDTLNKILRKYMLLLHAQDYTVEPILSHDWRCIFRNGWL